MRTTFPPMDGKSKSDRYTAWAAQYGSVEARRMANQLANEYAEAQKAGVKIQIIQPAQAIEPGVPVPPARPLTVADLRAQIANFRAEVAAFIGKPVEAAGGAAVPRPAGGAARRRKLLESTALGRKVLADEQARHKQK